MDVRRQATQDGPAGDPYRVFVGRETEVDALAGALGDASAGRGRLVLLAGEPGIGKTRLADVLAARAEDVGAEVLWGRCWEAGGAPPFWPWTQSLRGLVRSRSPEELRAYLGRGAAEVAQLLPEVRDLLPGVPEIAPAPPEAARFRLFQAVVDLLRNASADRPLVLILEDLQGADPSSVLLLRFVADELSAGRVLLVATYRDIDLEADHPLAAALPELLRVRAALRLTLGGLRPDDVAALVRAVSGTTPPASVVDAIHLRGDGGEPPVRPGDRPAPVGGGAAHGSSGPPGVDDPGRGPGRDRAPTGPPLE